MPRIVYRHVPFVQLLSYLHKDGLPLANPAVWSDKCEGGWIKKLFGENAPLHGTNVRALCASRDAYCEALWHVYARMQPVIRIGIRLQALLEAAKEADWEEGKFYVGDVAYLSSGGMKQCFKKAEKGKWTSSNAASLLHLKRVAFQYEDEVRIMWISRNVVPDIKWLSLDLKKSITRVLVAPQTEKWVVETIKSEMRLHGVKAQVQPSSLDTPPKWLLE